MLPVNCGLYKFNRVYMEAIASFFRYPQSVGIIGGRPRSSLYFVASQADMLFYMDPHETQAAVDMSQPFSPISFHCPEPRRIAIADLDPSLTIGFYCRTFADFEDLCLRLQDDSERLEHPLLNVAWAPPDMDGFGFSDSDEEGSSAAPSERSSRRSFDSEDEDLVIV